jgi:ADP-heptose:LPS heptosyltransferase/glycosyltransferase involved in cell wall biosynthesis
MKVLLPRLDTFGDIVLLEPLLSAIQQHWPSAELHLLVRQAYSGLAPLMPSFLHWQVTAMEPWAVLKRQLRADDDIMPLLNSDWDLLLQTSFNRNWLDEEIAQTMAARGTRCVRIGRAGDSSSSFVGDTVPVPEFSREGDKYQIVHDVLIANGSKLRAPCLGIPADGELEANYVLGDRQLDARSYIACVPGGALNNVHKMWSVDGFADCALHVESTYGLKTLFLGQEVERPIVERALNLAQQRGCQASLWIGADGQLPVLTALLRSARLYVGNDTGPMHFAQAVGTPAVAIFGGWHWPRFMPAGPAVACVSPLHCFGCGGDCLFGNAPCISSVRTQSVKSGIDRLLSGAVVEGCEVLESTRRESYSGAEIKSISTHFQPIARTANRAVLLERALQETSRRVQMFESENAALLHRIQVQSGSGSQYERDQNGSRLNLANANEEMQALRVELAQANEERQALRDQVALANQERYALRHELALSNEKVFVLEQKEIPLLRTALVDGAEQRAQLKTSLDESETRIQRLQDDAFEWLLASHSGPPRTITLEQERQAGLISVVIPMFNGAPFVENCVRSVWAQTGLPGEHSIEILLCDDGSRDSSLELAAKLQSDSPVPMRVLTHPEGGNHGVGPTRNLGIVASRGKFIALLDVDDQWLPAKLATQLAYFAAHPEVRAVCSYGYNKNLEGSLVRGWNNSEIAGCYRHLEPPDNLSPPYTFDLVLQGDPIVNSTMVIRWDALAETGGYTRVLAHQAEDWLLFMKLALASPIALIETPLIDYLVHSGSYTHQYFSSGLGWGARIETLYQLLHWMMQSSDYRSKARWVYRRHLPSLLATRAPAYRIIERYYRQHNGHVDDVEAFEAHLCRIQTECEELRNYQRHIEAHLDLLRSIPGSTALYHGALRVYRSILRSSRR